MHYDKIVEVTSPNITITLPNIKFNRYAVTQMAWTTPPVTLYRSMTVNINGLTQQSSYTSDGFKETSFTLILPPYTSSFVSAGERPNEYTWSSDQVQSVSQVNITTLIDGQYRPLELSAINPVRLAIRFYSP